MADGEWSDILASLRRARRLLETMTIVTPDEEKEHLRVADGLIGALTWLTEEAIVDARLVPPDLASAVDEVHTRLVSTLRLPIAERRSQFEGLNHVLLQAVETFSDGAVVRPERPSAASSAAKVVTTFEVDDLRSYAADAKSQSRLMWTFATLALLVIAVLAFSCLWLILRGAPNAVRNAPVISGFVVLGLLALAAVHQARECRRTLLEIRRVHRQLLTIDRYLSPLPKLGQDLLRAVMTQRLFPRLIDDDNPMREDDVFPQESALMVALSSEVRAAQGRQTRTVTSAEGSTKRSAAQASAPPAANPATGPASSAG